MAHPDTHHELRALLKAQKLRATSVRLAVLEALHEKQAPMTHQQVMTALGEDGFDKASIWRILSELSEKGLLRRMDLGDRIWRYELIDACRPIDAHHAHFLCGDCGEVTCLPPLELRTPSGELPVSLQRADFTIRIEGICGNCLEASS